MIQKLSLVSVLTLVALAAAGSVVVASHAFSGGASTPLNGSPQVLVSPLVTPPGDAGNSTAPGSVSQTATQGTVTVTVTHTNSTSSSSSTSTTTSTSTTSSTSSSTSTSTQNSTSSSGGSLLVTSTTTTSSGSSSGHHGDGSD